MRSLTLSPQTKVWFSLLLAAGLMAFGLAWLALVGAGPGEAGAWPPGSRLTGRQAPELVRPFSPQSLAGGLAPEQRNQAARP